MQLLFRLYLLARCGLNSNMSCCLVIIVDVVLINSLGWCIRTNSDRLLDTDLSDYSLTRLVVVFYLIDLISVTSKQHFIQSYNALH